MDKRGISPIVATIVLIAMTVVAGGVIGVFVSGMYVGSTTVTAGEVSGTIYDNNADAATLDYKGGKIILNFWLTSGGMYSINDAADGLFVYIRAVTAGQGATYNWGPVNLGPPTGTAGTILTKTGTITGTTAATYDLRVPSDSAYGFPRGSIGSLTLNPSSLDNNNWNENTEFTIRVTCGGRRIETAYAVEPFESSLP